MLSFPQLVFKCRYSALLLDPTVEQPLAALFTRNINGSASACSASSRLCAFARAFFVGVIDFRTGAMVRPEGMKNMPFRQFFLTIPEFGSNYQIRIQQEDELLYLGKSFFYAVS